MPAVVTVISYTTTPFSETVLTSATDPNYAFSNLPEGIAWAVTAQVGCGKAVTQMLNLSGQGPSPAPSCADPHHLVRDFGVLEGADRSSASAFGLTTPENIVISPCPLASGAIAGGVPLYLNNVEAPATGRVGVPVTIDLAAAFYDGCFKVDHVKTVLDEQTNSVTFDAVAQDFHSFGFACTQAIVSYAVQTSFTPPRAGRYHIRAISTQQDPEGKVRDVDLVVDVN